MRLSRLSVFSGPPPPDQYEAKYAIIYGRFRIERITEVVEKFIRIPCFAPGLNCVHVLDFRTGRHRPAVLRDIEETARLCERLPSIELAGGWDSLAEKPFALDLMGPYSPLELGEEACRRLRFPARRRLPVVCYPALLMGAAGPVTLAGALAQSQAEILTGLVVHQLEQPGAPVLSGSSILPMDLRFGSPAYGSPEYVQACLGAVDSLEQLGVPTWVGAGCSDAHTVDAQAAAEAGMNLLAAACTGTAFVHNLGYLSGGKTGSLEMLVLCDELAGAVRAFSAGIAVNEDTLAVEAVRRAALDHSFLVDEHTLETPGACPPGG